MSAGAKTPAARPTILAVDDDTTNLAILGRLLHAHYNVLAAPSGERALAIAAGSPRPDLILLDVVMPEMDGYTVLARLRGNPATRDIPVIFATGLDSTEDEEKGLALGAVDYIAKPFRPPVVLARVRTHLELKRARDWLKDQNVYLEAEVARRTQDILLVQDITIDALAELAETRDPETGNHIRRTREYVRILAVHLQANPRYSAVLTATTIELLAKSAPLHDIGKVGIPDHILLKPGRLSPEEWAIMQTHARLGADAIAHAIEHAQRDAARPVAFLALAGEIAHWHHEKWDGSGYPDGLAGAAIPLSARLMALADVFDALISPRVYKQPMPFDQARAIIVEGRGGHFDPDVVDAFIEGFDEFTAIAGQYGDDETAATGLG